ncbi:hypothetical protein RUM44_012612 [Polyplax serrata]|uniref:cysteine--tRNA ligase n=1 Tax=Polyplax serrata TaxID=468196 RepID=A0ABR1BFU9_POLSC
MFTKPWLYSTKSFHKYSAQRSCQIRLKYQWKCPVGCDTGIKIYNRNVEKKVPLILSNKHFVKWYICGPTVYDSAHVGHASSYVRFDIIRRILENFFNVKPVIAIGVTDIDDKIIKRSKQLNTDCKSLAKKYELEFFDNLKELNVLPPAFVLRVTDHIEEIINFISVIIEKEHAYATDDGCVYFDVEKSENYGKLIKLVNPLTSPKGNKKSSFDFALWKACKPGEPFWESPWGKGRPGWHIECSAMSSKVFGSTLDLHSGGLDLLFPHHENEEAQSCSYHGCDQWVNYWFYTGLLYVEDEKMSKSLQNFITISDLLKSYTVDNFRMFCFISKYNTELQYKTGSMEHAVGEYNKILRFLADSKSYINGNWNLGNISEPILLEALQKTSKNVTKNLANDFDTGACFSDIMELVSLAMHMLHDQRLTNIRSPGTIAAVSQYVEGLLHSFGFQLGSSFSQQNDYAREEFIISSAVNFRNEVRANALSCNDTSVKQNLLKASDSFRNDLKSVGITVKDQGKNVSAWGNM